MTLAIHGTSDVLEVVEKKPSNWDGPISFGMFVDYHSQKALEYVAMLHQCDKEFGEKVSTIFWAFKKYLELSGHRSLCVPNFSFPDGLSSDNS